MQKEKHTKKLKTATHVDRNLEFGLAGPIWCNYCINFDTAQGEEKAEEKTETKTDLSNLPNRNLGSMDLGLTFSAI